MAYLFDTNAVSEAMRPGPNKEYVDWLGGLPREEQFTSSVVIGEMFAGAYASPATAKWLSRIETLVLPSMTVLNFDVATAHEYGKVRALLRKSGQVIDEAVGELAVHEKLAVPAVLGQPNAVRPVQLPYEVDAVTDQQAAGIAPPV